jgi:hypothetical protein
MIHVATVHYQNDEWIDIQLEYLEKYLDREFKVYAFLNEIDERHQKKFFYCSTEPVTASSQEEEHAIKLNILADVIGISSDSPDDLLIFLDGDAFPVSDVFSYARSKLKEYSLAAVQRLENAGDIQPHPCFCVTTVGFWHDIGGDWKPGYRWVNDRGEVTDVGGNLLGILEENDVDWYPMRRSNDKNMHPLWFGIYDNVIYHHGAGFRSAVSRLDIERNILLNISQYSLDIYEKITEYFPKELKLSVIKKIRNKLSNNYQKEREKVGCKNSKLSKNVKKMIREDEDFYEKFL